MKFTFQRDRTVESTLGHCIEFKKGVPTYVPPELHRTVYDMGGEPSEPLAEETKQVVTAPEGATARAEAIEDAIRILVDTNNRDDFTGNGSPQVKSLEALLGWKPDAAERDAAWLAVQAGD